MGTSAITFPFALALVLLLIVVDNREVVEVFAVLNELGFLKPVLLEHADDVLIHLIFFFNGVFFHRDELLLEVGVLGADPPPEKGGLFGWMPFSNNASESGRRTRHGKAAEGTNVTKKVQLRGVFAARERWKAHTGLKTRDDLGPKRPQESKGPPTTKNNVSAELE